MSKDHRRYLRSEKASRDLSQLTFGKEGQVQARARVTFKTTSVDLTKIVFCPFCLGEDKIQNFLTSTKEGISQSRGECPSCHNGMLIKTLLREWTPEAYAEYVFNYTRSGFWQKINFAEWKDRLFRKGWAEAFWLRYKALKAESAEAAYGSPADDHGEQGGEY